MAAVFAADRPASRAGPHRRAPSPGLRANLFGDWKSTLTTVVDGRARAVYCCRRSSTGPSCSAVLRPDADACQAARGVGACWGVIAEKYRLIIFGRYPFERAVAARSWRPSCWWACWW